MKFSKEFLQEMEGETIYDRIAGKSRWSLNYERVFKHEDKFYRTRYSVGATESQNESPYEHDSDDPIECVEVFPSQETITVFKPKEK